MQYPFCRSHCLFVILGGFNSRIVMGIVSRGDLHALERFHCSAFPSSVSVKAQQFVCM